MKAARAARPERSVYESWVREHHAAVWRAARRILRDDALASDVAQRVYVRAFEHGLELAAGESPERLLCWMACKESLTELRGRRRRAAHEERAAMRDDDAVPGPFEQTSAAEARAWLARELDALAEDMRTVLVLRYQQGLSLREIGALLELAESSVHERVERGLGRLRKRAERAGLAGVLVDWSGELSACEPASAPPSSLAPSLLESTSTATAWSSGALLVPACVLLVAAIAAGAWWTQRSTDARPRDVAAVALENPAASDAGTRLVDAATPAGIARAEVAAPEPVAPAAAIPAASVPSSAAVAQTVVSGRIVDADRVPLAGISLALTPLRRKDIGSFQQKHASFSTDAAGRFREALPSGPVYALSAEFHARLDAPVHLKTEGLTENDLGDIEVGARAAEIYGEWTLAVRVRDERGAPLDRIEVRVEPIGVPPQTSAHQWRASTDATGRIELAGDRRGEFEVWTNSRPAGYQPERVVRTFERGAHDLELVLRPTRELAGRLVTPGGEPLDDTLLTVEQPEFHARAIAEPDPATGEFELIGLCDGALTISRGGGRYSGFDVHYATPPAGPLVLELKRGDDPRDVGLHLGEFHGRCVDTAGAPVEVEPGRVSVVPMSAESSGDFWSDAAGALRAFGGQVAFGPDGRPARSAQFHLTGLDPGRYALVACADGYANGIAGPFVIDAIGANSATIQSGIEIVFEKPWTLVAELARGPAMPAEGEALWLASGSGEPTPLAGAVVGETIEWTGLHPRIPYRIVLQGANGARLESALIRSGGSGREVVRFDGWPGRP